MSSFEKMLYDGMFSEEFNGEFKFDGTEFDFSLDENFLNMTEKSFKIKPVLEQYTFKSLSTAIFAINAWKSNRSAQESCLSLNRAFIFLENEGKKEISSYEEFCVFFNSIEPFLQISIFDDHVLNDFGEIKISYLNKFHPIITGTGHSGCVFSVLNFLEELSKSTMKQNETLSILDFVNRMLSSLCKYNTANKNNTHIGFELPSADFYSAVIHYIEDLPVTGLNQNVIDMFSKSDLPVVETHFCKKNDTIFLLFNPSLLLDYQSNILRNIDDETLSKIVKKSLINKIDSIYLSKTMKNRELLTEKFLICENRIPLKVEYSGFILSLNKRVFLFIEEGSVEDKKEFVNDINSILQNNQLSIVNLNNKVANRQFEGFQVACETRLDIVFYNDYINISQPFATLGSRDDILSYTALDLMFIILFASNIDEIADFINREEPENTQILSMGGIADYFISWKLENGHISKGAIEYNTMHFEYESAATYIYEEYIKLQSFFPFEVSNLPIGCPEEWSCTIDEHKTNHIARKSVDFSGGSLFQFENGLIIFLCYDFMQILKHESVDQSKIYNDFLRGLFEQFLHEYREQVSKINSYTNQFVKITFESFSIEIEGKAYSKIEFDKQNDNCLYLKCNIDTKKLMSNIIECSDRSVEIDFLIEIFGFLLANPYSKEIVKVLESKKELKKTVDASFYKADYYYNPEYTHIRVSEKDFILARKQIAIIAKKLGVAVGNYTKKEATNIVRTLQGELIPYFEESITKFSKLDIHTMLLQGYSYELLFEYTNDNAYRLSDNISKNDRERNQSILFKQREDGKQIQLAYQYFIESNLSVERDRDSQTFTNEDASKLLALSEWLVMLQHNADICFSSPDEEIQFVVLDDYRIDIEPSETYILRLNKNRKRLYNSGMNILKGDENDKDYFSKIATAFFVDTGVNFHVLEVVMRQLYESSFDVENTNFSELIPNVIRISKSDAYTDCLNFVEEKVEIEMVKKAYDFLTIQSSTLKFLKGKQIPVLPIWEREKRDNRFTTKPLLEVGDSYIYSPITIKEVHNRWFSGLQQFFPPYEIGLEKTIQELKGWKEFYEKSFAKDIANIFAQKEFEYAKDDVDIRKEDRDGNHPLIGELGDYDVIGLDTAKKRIYIIECKVLQPVGNAYEHIQQQKRFFLEKKYDEKFQHRINYFLKVYTEFFMRKGFNVKEYSIQSYMVVNKPFDSYYKDVSFNIVTVDELNNLIDAN